MPLGINKLPRTFFGGAQVQTDDCAADLKVHDRLLHLSFETGEQASHKIYLTQAARITGLRRSSYGTSSPSTASRSTTATRRWGGGSAMPSSRRFPT